MRPQPRASKFLELVFQLFVGHLERIFFDLVLLLAQQTRTISAASRPAPDPAAAAMTRLRMLRVGGQKEHNVRCVEG